MRKATATGLASKNSGGRRSLDMQAVASQPRRWETRLPLKVYTQGFTDDAVPRQGLWFPKLSASRTPRALHLASLCHNSYCRPYTAMHPLALCVPQSAPACVGTKI